MQDPGSWLTMQEPGSRMPMQDSGSRMPMQDPGSRMPMQDPGSRLTIQGLGPWDPFGAIWAHLGPILFGAHLGPFGVLFYFVWGPFGVHLGPFGAHLGPFGARGLFWPILTYFIQG